MWLIFGILLIAVFIGGAIVAPWTAAEEDIEVRNWKRGLWIILCAAGYLCYCVTGLKWVSYVTIAVMAIGLFAFKKTGKV